ncbi:MAG: hypothetical protein SGJ07_03530 [Rhodospirillaceae bacterium]|nr:hypothetical protein [Rhodospirillaceae bacterium]
MILFLLCRAGNHTIRDSYLYDFPGIAGRVYVVNYEGVMQQRMMPYGCYVFTDVDRATPELRAGIEAFYDFLGTQGPKVRRINHPTQSLQRYALLRTLFQRGINDFDVYHMSEDRRPKRYPVFLRREDTHDGPLGKALDNRDALENALAKQLKRGEPIDRLLAVEICDVRDGDGLVRKYGAFYVNGTVIPRHVVISTDWVAKFTDFAAVEPYLTLNQQLLEEARYVEENPHAEQIAETFRIARIDYGRIDYSLKDGAIRVWEINTNPVIAEARNIDGSQRHRLVLEPGVRRLAQAIAQLDAGLPRGRFAVDPTIMERLAATG